MSSDDTNTGLGGCLLTLPIALAALRTVSSSGEPSADANAKSVNRTCHETQ
jgi:hypothetical protein